MNLSAFIFFGIIAGHGAVTAHFDNLAACSNAITAFEAETKYLGEIASAYCLPTFIPCKHLTTDKGGLC